MPDFAATPQHTELQRAFWNAWNASTRELKLSDISRDQGATVLRWLESASRNNMNILEVGCGAGWLCPWLKVYGHVTATDLSDEVLSRARQRVPDVSFIVGDFMTLDFAPASFDVIIALEVLSHVADQPGFVAKLASLLKPGGMLMLATQNRPVLEKHNVVPMQQPGQIRRWVDREELHRLLSAEMEVRELFSVTPTAKKGPMRLLAGRRAQRFWRTLTGRGMEAALAKAGLGWTLMALARRR